MPCSSSGIFIQFFISLLKNTILYGLGCLFVWLFVCVFVCVVGYGFGGMFGCVVGNCIGSCMGNCMGCILDDLYFSWYNEEDILCIEGVFEDGEGQV